MGLTQLKKRSAPRKTSKEKKAAEALVKLKKSGASRSEKTAAAGLLKLSRKPRCKKTNSSAACEANRCIRSNMKKNMSKARKENMPYNKSVAASLKTSYKACGVALPPRKKGPPKRPKVTWRKRALTK